MACEGRAAEEYDLFAIGAADREVEREIDAHLEENCAACIAGLRRSLKLWTYYASTLDEADPSANLRARLVELARLTRRVAPLPVRAPAPRPAWMAHWGLQAIAAAITLLVGAGGWYAGKQTGRVDHQQLLAALTEAQRQVATLRVSVRQEIGRRRQLEEALNAAGTPNAAQQQDTLRQKVLELEAQVSGYRDVIARDQRALSDNVRLVSALSTPGIRLVPLKGLEYATHSVAYSLVAENDRVLFVASNLPPAPKGRQYQLWLLRANDPKVVSAGVFSADDGRRALLEFNDPATVSNLTAVAVTEEPAGGSAAGPTGRKVFAGTTE